MIIYDNIFSKFGVSERSAYDGAIKDTAWWQWYHNL